MSWETEAEEWTSRVEFPPELFPSGNLPRFSIHGLSDPDTAWDTVLRTHGVSNELAPSSELEELMQHTRQAISLRVQAHPAAVETVLRRQLDLFTGLLSLTRTSKPEDWTLLFTYADPERGKIGMTIRDPAHVTGFALPVPGTKPEGVGQHPWPIEIAMDPTRVGRSR